MVILIGKLRIGLLSMIPNLTPILITLGIFSYTAFRIYRFFRLTKPYPVKHWGKRFAVMMSVAFGQTKIFRRPVLGLMHALVWWGFIVILIGSIEMIIDGLTGTERILSFLGPVYDVIVGLGDVFAFVILVLILAFLFRRLFLHVKRFAGTEMKHVSHMDANIALSLIGLLMTIVVFARFIAILPAPTSKDELE